MKATLIFTIIILLSIAGNSQTKKAKPSSVEKYNAANGNFFNQGDQEKYWAAKLFEDEYAKQKFERFKGTLEVINAHTLKYGNTVVEIYTDATLKTIFEKGIVYPGILPVNEGGILIPPVPHIPATVKAKPAIDLALQTPDTLYIPKIEELQFLNPSPQIKRFKLWIYHKGLANPNIYFIELTNLSATKNTDMLTFINRSKLTFYRYGWTTI